MPANMLLSEYLQELKVADFGVCRYFNKVGSLTTGRGHLKCMAPEVRNIDEINQKMHKSYPSACDVYSWALCCYYALTGIESNKLQANNLPAVIRQRVVPNTDRTLAAFLNEAISDNVAGRPTAAKCETTLKSYQEDYKGRLLALSVEGACFFRFAPADLPQAVTAAIGPSSANLC